MSTLKDLTVSNIEYYKDYTLLTVNKYSYVLDKPFKMVDIINNAYEYQYDKDGNIIVAVPSSYVDAKAYLLPILERNMKKENEVVPSGGGTVEEDPKEDVDIGDLKLNDDGTFDYDFIGQWSDGVPLPSAKSGDIGYYFFQTSTGDVYKKITDLHWERIGNLKGAKGDTGEKGDRGLTGSQGARGRRGLQGARGLQGEPGTYIYDGIGVPSLDIGVVGDLYLQLDTDLTDIGNPKDLYRRYDSYWERIGNLSINSLGGLLFSKKTLEGMKAISDNNLKPGAICYVSDEDDNRGYYKYCIDGIWRPLDLESGGAYSNMISRVDRETDLDSLFVTSEIQPGAMCYVEEKDCYYYYSKQFGWTNKRMYIVSDEEPVDKTVMWFKNGFDVPDLDDSLTLRDVSYSLKTLNTKIEMLTKKVALLDQKVANGVINTNTNTDNIEGVILVDSNTPLLVADDVLLYF